MAILLSVQAFLHALLHEKQQTEQQKHDGGKGVGRSRHILIIHLVIHVVHVVLKRVYGFGGIRAANEINLAKYLERADPFHNDDQKRTGHNHRQRNGKALAEKARAFQPRIFVQRLRNRLQRRKENNDCEAKILATTFRSGAVD